MPASRPRAIVAVLLKARVLLATLLGPLQNTLRKILGLEVVADRKRQHLRMFSHVTQRSVTLPARVSQLLF
ncbi:hypothetical protein LAZ67_4001397 [Cordylochernes scorpioides]|uniref:Secreted protein n=1 Tax=Cordylochernes scorpioides TaxID=51811 RepID=A0ABY6KBV5_9ARAC|nr:hypothetical protein LAZ67_4001397 [Cordylochernes scorpioides]